MRRTTLALVTSGLLIGAGAAEAQTVKIGYLNSQEVLNSAPGAAEAQAQFDRVGGPGSRPHARGHQPARVERRCSARRQALIEDSCLYRSRGPTGG